MTKPLLFILISLSFLMAQGVADWQTLTNMNDVRGLTFFNGQIWAVSDGGMFGYDLESGDVQKVTNVEGLRSIDLTCITVNSKGQLIVAGREGILQIYNPSDGSWQYQYALQDNEIQALNANQDTLWVTTLEGIGVLVDDGRAYVFKDFFHNFPQNIDTAFVSAVFAGKIWLGTNKGLLAAPSDFGRFPINDPQRWQVFTVSQNLPNNRILALLPDGDKLWLGASSGLAYVTTAGAIVQVSNWGRSTNGKFLPVQNLIRSAEKNKIYAQSNNTLYDFDLQSGINKIQTFEEQIQALTITDQGQWWVGLHRNGLVNQDGQNIKIDGPPENLLRRVMKDHQKRIWASSSRPKIVSQQGIFVYNGSSWQKILFRGRYWQTINNANVLYQDRFNNIWIGSWGGGVLAFTATGDTVFFHSYDFPARMDLIDINKFIEFNPVGRFTIYNDFFTGVVPDQNYEIITDIKEGPQGRLWFANYWAANDHLLAVAPYDANGFISLDKNKWVYFGSDDGIKVKEGGILCIEFDKFANRVYVGTLYNGLYILDYGNIDDPNDNKVYQLNIQDNLFSNTIFSLALDQDGVLWIGTAAGLNSFDGINVYKHVGDDHGLSGPLENEIHHIFVDQFNNKWFSTKGGLSILRGDHSPWDARGWLGYNRSNSYLVDDNVQCVYVDYDNNEALVATEGGLSIYRGPFAEIEKKFEKTEAGPNPFVMESHSQKFVIKNLMFNSTVKILNINGQLVRELTPKTVLNDGTLAVDGGRAYWDGFDQTGNKVASGVYLYLAISEEGKSISGKIAVIRK